MNPCKLDKPTNPDWTLLRLAENQKDIYNPLDVWYETKGIEARMVSKWQPTPEELTDIKEQIEETGTFSLYLSVFTFGKQFQPVLLEATPPGEPNTLHGAPEGEM